MLSDIVKNELSKGNVWLLLLNESQYDDIVYKLAEWRNDRNITLQDQHPVFLGNSLEEITEYERAKNEYEKIDALCDLIVFHINSAYNMVYENYIKIDGFGIEKGDNTSSLASNLVAYNKKIINENEYLFSLVYAIYDLGFDPYECIIETIKEISSREQDPKQKAEWESDGKLGKWMKNKEQDPSTLYKADYEKCRITSKEDFIKSFYK